MKYYNGDGLLIGRNVSKIISQVVKGLLEDPQRKFSYVEQVSVSVRRQTLCLITTVSSVAGLLSGIAKDRFC